MFPSMGTERQNKFFFPGVDVLREQGKFTFVACIVIYNLLFINLVWYTPLFIGVFVFAWIGQNSMHN